MCRGFLVPELFQPAHMLTNTAGTMAGAGTEVPASANKCQHLCAAWHPRVWEGRHSRAFQGGIARGLVLL